MSWANLITRSRYPLGRTICSKVVPGDSLGVQIRQTRPCIRLILVESSCCIHLCMSGSFSCSDFNCILLLMSFIWFHCRLCSLLSALVLRVFGFDCPNTSSLNGNSSSVHIVSSSSLSSSCICTLPVSSSLLSSSCIRTLPVSSSLSSILFSPLFSSSS